MNVSKPKSQETLNHRTRVGQDRRQKMRMRLMESALVVFSTKGIDATVIEDVIAEAGVSRGSFYNYFRTTSELVTALGEVLAKDLINQIETHARDLDDPVEILATGLRLFLHTARAHPNFASFVWRAGLNMASVVQLLYTYLPPHISRCIERKAFRVADVASALEIMAGIILTATYAISTRSPCEADYPERMVQHALLALGVSLPEVQRLTSLSLQGLTLPADSLLVKTRY